MGHQASESMVWKWVGRSWIGSHLYRRGSGVGGKGVDEYGRKLIASIQEFLAPVG